VVKTAFDKPMSDEWTSRALAHAIYGGADFGECTTTAGRVAIGDADSWYREWNESADRVYKIAEASEVKGHKVSAREAYLRASNYYRTSYPFFYGAPVDPRLVQAFDKEAAAFRRAAALFDPSVEHVEIPYGGATLPGYFYRVDDSNERRPTLIATNGYDSTIHEMHFAHAVAAVRRGYNCLTFDGPGQGRALIKQNLHMRPDWENVVAPVVDYALSRPEVDPERVALIGWSFGGYLAPRAASGEHRLAACIADPGQWDFLEAIKGNFARFGTPKKVVDRLPDVDPKTLEPFFEAVDQSPRLTWTFKQRGLWVHGVDSIMDFLRITPQYSLSDRVDEIRCPTLITWAESDPVAGFAEKLYEALTCLKTLVRFTNAEGAGDHCEMNARTLFHQRAFDWLDETLEVSQKR
jgi:pimeloyl-ACP methyl ester carboxylesterase